MARRLPSSPPVLPGFTYVTVLGSGGFADVFLYEQDMPRRQVAVKVMLAEIVTDRLRAMFRAEADLMAQLSAHPSVLTVHQASVAADGRPYLVMELCSSSLSDRYRREPLGVAEVLRVGIRIASAVETAHRAGVLHRDIKPANILTTAFGHPVLSDFGIASTLEDAAATDAVGLSIPWSAPEVLADESPGTVRSEVWSLAATVYSLLAGRNAELVVLRREEAELRARLHGITEDVHGLELQIYEKRLQVSQLLERAASELGLGEEVLVAEYGPDVPVPEEAPLPPRQRPRAPVDDGVGDAAADPDDAAASAETSVPSAEPSGTADEAAEMDADGDAPPVPTRPFDREEQRARLQSAERKLAQLGRVNPLALEEFAALEQRHLFLTEQLADLTATRKDLLTIIDDIDRTMQGVFAAAFEDTRQAFDRVFPILFPGGTGSIHLTDPEQLLTTGIEVSVRPAGKRIERLSLLSGGERSLAAVALLIAIFTARPSPFYIMDEVEAALDDANLGRLLTILEQLRDTSQLIVITHQKRTMEIADALYGVSMRQDGVSAVVGQRVSRDARPDPAPASAGEDEPDGAPATEQEPAPEEQAAS
ncbi:serine/threonine protein kinase [Clavibacter michiganensis]|uniref:serine/threonine protein kinase n=1 Tax=Clavibacter michiganensis TaxID=28447 RepID=UPI00292E1237|nr:protein kinase [Clavibacter michiganensis]